MPLRGKTLFLFLKCYVSGELENLVPVVGNRTQPDKKNRVFGVFTSGKSPTFSGAFGANRTWCILEKVPIFWISGISPKATPFAKYPKIFLRFSSNNYLFFILQSLKQRESLKQHLRYVPRNFWVFWRLEKISGLSNVVKISKICRETCSETPRLAFGLKNSVWRRLRRAKGENEQKTRF